MCSLVGDVLSPDLFNDRGNVKGFIGRFFTDGKGRGYKEYSDKLLTVTNPFSIIGRSCVVSKARPRARPYSAATSY